MKKCGRPLKTAFDSDNKKKIIDTTINLIRTDGADSLTVRAICQKCDLSAGTFYHYFQSKDDLLVYFLKSGCFFHKDFGATLSDPVEYVVALYMSLVAQYQDLGIRFMKNFYSCGNTALSSYMGQRNRSFAPDTIMYVCEQRLKQFQADGKLRLDADPHEISEDVCTIVKGCVFEWCICDSEMELEKTLRRIIEKYFQDSLCH